MTWGTTPTIIRREITPMVISFTVSRDTVRARIGGARAAIQTLCGKPDYLFINTDLVRCVVELGISMETKWLLLTPPEWTALVA